MRFAAIILLLAYPILEIALFIKAGRAIGILGVLAVIVATAFIGSAIMRRQGLGVATRLSEALERGESPPGPALEDGLALLSGALLVAPGLATDALGALLLVPPVRAAIAAGVRGYLRRTPVPESRPPEYGGGPVIEGEFERVEERDVPAGRGPDGSRRN